MRRVCGSSCSRKCSSWSRNATRGLGGRLLVEDRQQLLAVAVALAGFQVGVALGGLVEGDLAERLVQGDAHQQLAEVVLVLESELAVLEADEEGAEDRLDDVLGVHAAGEALADAPAGQDDQAVEVAIDDLAGGVLVAAPPQVDEGLFLRGSRHVGRSSRDDGRSPQPDGRAKLRGGEKPWYNHTRRRRVGPREIGRG